MNSQPLTDEYVQRRGIFSWLKDALLGSEELDEDEVEGAPAATPPAPGRKQSPSLSLQTSRGGRVAVRLNAQVFEDAKLAADGLKSGEFQIVNMERATPQMAERIIDFLNGVCYALDGTVERVGTKVVMFVPANVAVEVDKGVAATAASVRRPTYGAD